MAIYLSFIHAIIFQKWVPPLLYNVIVEMTFEKLVVFILQLILDRSFVHVNYWSIKPQMKFIAIFPPTQTRLGEMEQHRLLQIMPLCLHNNAHAMHAHIYVSFHI